MCERMLQGLRPPIPRSAPPLLSSLMERCWDTNPSQRPEFADIVKELVQIIAEVSMAPL